MQDVGGIAADKFYPYTMEIGYSNPQRTFELIHQGIVVIRGEEDVKEHPNPPVFYKSLKQEKLDNSFALPASRNSAEQRCSNVTCSSAFAPRIANQNGAVNQTLQLRNKWNSSSPLHMSQRSYPTCGLYSKDSTFIRTIYGALNIQCWVFTKLGPCESPNNNLPPRNDPITWKQDLPGGLSPHASQSNLSYHSEPKMKFLSPYKIAYKCLSEIFHFYLNLLKEFTLNLRYQNLYLFMCALHILCQITPVLSCLNAFILLCQPSAN